MRYRLKPDLGARVSDTTLPNRAKRWLQVAGITTIGDLIQRTEEDLLTIPNFAYTSLEAVRNYLGDRGLSLAPPREDRCPTDWVVQAMSASECNLERRERDVLKVRHGIAGKALTLEQAGRKFRLTRERVRQIQKKAEQKVMSYMIFHCGMTLPDGRRTSAAATPSVHVRTGAEALEV